MKIYIIIYTTLLSFIISTAECQTVINSYAAVLGYDVCLNQFAVDNSSGFNAGDDVLLIQMKGANIDTSNSATFGTLITLNNCGNYEINRVQSVIGNTVTLTFALARSYDIPQGKVQLVKIPRHNNYTVSVPHTCQPWSGTKGGVFAIIVNNTFSLNDKIDVSEKGFIGGVNVNPTYHLQFVRNQTDYCHPINNQVGAMKGEGITEVSSARMYCRGQLYNGGGGGNSTNSGGGGGANGGTGGRGGDEWVGAPPTPVGGRGGHAFTYNSSVNKITMGGGGGAGDVNDANITNGGNGGGIVIIMAGSIAGNNDSIIANGQQGRDCFGGGNSCNDGFGGGGSGGTILLNTQSISQLNISLKGGKGAHVGNVAGHGPGGGGGGGAILVNTPSHFGNINYTNAGGPAGTITLNGNTVNWGAQPGSAGDTTSGFNIPVANIPFVPNAFNTIISDSLSGCTTIKINVSGNSNISSVTWNFGDGNQATGNPATHTYAQSGTYTITAISTSADGCKDTVTKSIILSAEQIDELITDSTFACKNLKLHATSLGTKAKNHTWQTGDGNTATGNPAFHTYNASGSYTITLIAEDSLGCLDTFTQAVIVGSNLKYGIDDSAISCTEIFCDTLNLGNSYASTIQWFFGNGDFRYNSPVSYKYNRTGTYNIKLVTTDSIGCTDTVTKTIALEQLPIPLKTSNDTTICYASTITLTVSGASTYKWSPKNGLNKDFGESILAMPVEPITYKVVGTDVNGCIGYDSITIGILPYPNITISSSGDKVTCHQPEVELTAYGGIRYVWGPEELIENKESPVQKVRPSVTTKYHVYGYDENGCWEIATKVVMVDMTPAIFIADAFTPNNDGTNDIIRPYVLCNFKMTQFSIFNRWGQEVFKTTDITQGWNGTFNGKPQGLGTYFYMITGNSEDGEKALFKGNITLIK